METFKWSSIYEVGIPKVDAQHKMFVDLANTLFAAMLSHTAVDVDSTLDTLLTYAKEHFQTELELMQASNYPNMDAHVSAHDKLMQRLQLVCVSSKQDTPHAFTIRMSAFMRDWVLGHLLQEDRKLYSYLRDTGAAPLEEK